MLPVQVVLCSRKKKSKKKGRTLAFERVKLPEVCSFHTTSSLTSSSMTKYNDDKEKSEKKREETRPRESKLPVLEPPLSVLSRRLFIHLPFS